MKSIQLTLLLIASSILYAKEDPITVNIKGTENYSLVIKDLQKRVRDLEKTVDKLQKQIITYSDKNVDSSEKKHSCFSLVFSVCNHVRKYSNILI